MFQNINPTNKNTLHYSWLQQMESKSLNLLIEEEEEKEVEIVHDDYDDPVLASTPPSLGTNAVSPERSTRRSRRTFVEDKLDIIVQNQKALFKLLLEFIKEQREMVVCCCQTGIKHGYGKFLG